MSLLSKILLKSLLNASKVASVDDRGTRTYGEYLVGAGMFSRIVDQAMPARSKGGHIGLMLPTSAAMPLGILGAWMAGRIPVPVNYLLGREELQFCMTHAPIESLITVKPMLDHIGGMEVIPKSVKVTLLEDALPKVSKWSALRLPPRITSDQTAVILYTSGTSGKPKGVPLTFGNFDANVTAALAQGRFTQADVFLSVLPQFHSFGLTACTLFPLLLGAKAVYAARFAPKKILELIRLHRPTIFMAVPSMYGALLSLKDAKPEDFKSLRLCISGGEALPDATRRQIKERFDVDLLQGYGLTETTPVVAWSTPQEYREGYSGKILSNVDVQVVDENENPLPRNTQGEILIAGPNVFTGYHRDPEASAGVFKDLVINGQTRRYFRSGDIGVVDENNMLAITGRKKEMIIVGGFNVFPRAIEEVLNNHPTIKDSGVIGREDGLRGEVPVAFVELKEGSHFDEAALRAHCRDNLATYKVPRDIICVDALPRTPTGKVLRRKLKELL